MVYPFCPGLNGLYSKGLNVVFRVVGLSSSRTHKTRIST